MGRIVRITAHILLFAVAVVVFYLGLGIGLAWPGVNVAGIALSGPTAGTILWIVAGVILVLNVVWIVRARKRSQGHP